MGILYLASVAERKGNTCQIIDADVEGYSSGALINEIMSRDFDLIGITATTPIFHKAVLLAEGLKNSGFKGPILIGGEHINIFKDSALRKCFDYGFYGESDFSFGQFLDIISEGSRDFKSMEGFLYRDAQGIILTPPSERILDLDKIDFPAMHLLRAGKYRISFAKFKSRSYLPVMASRGCPFKCVFCSEPLTNPHVRFRAAGNIVDEIEKWIKDLGINHFFFMDSNLTLNRNQVEALCKEISVRKLRFTFEGWTRANLIDRQLLSLLKKAGLIRISYGIESGDQRILKLIKKEVSKNEILDAFKMTEELGIEPACSVMLGLPGETRESVEKTIRFVKSIPQVLYSNFSIANPYPGTELYEWALKGEHGLRMRTRDFARFSRYEDSPISVNDLEYSDLSRLQKIGLLRIHLAPKRMLAAFKILGFTCLAPVFMNLLFTKIFSMFNNHVKKFYGGSNKISGG